MSDLLEPPIYNTLHYVSRSGSSSSRRNNRPTGEAGVVEVAIRGAGAARVGGHKSRGRINAKGTGVSKSMGDWGKAVGY